MSQTLRLYCITRCMAELEAIRDAYWRGEARSEAMGMTIGELDQLSELHRLLYEMEAT